MDWYTWLSKTSLEPSLRYEYTLCFTHNELEQEDIVYFNHEFLQSMGISVAKHRLEILKLAKQEKRWKRFPISRLLKCMSRYVSRWIRREESALVVVPRPSLRWKGGLLRRSKRVGVTGMLMLTNGSSKVCESPKLGGFGGGDEDEVVDEEGYWLATVGVEEVRWDAMFQNLKPT